jgi:hypothetical protein
MLSAFKAVAKEEDFQDKVRCFSFLFLQSFPLFLPTPVVAPSTVSLSRAPLPWSSSLEGDVDQRK